MLTLAELFTQYLADTSPDHAPSTRYELQQFFARVLEELGDVSLDALTPDLLRAWQQRLSQQYKPATAHKYMVRLGGPSRFGVMFGCWTVAPLVLLRPST